MIGQSGVARATREGLTAGCGERRAGPRGPTYPKRPRVAEVSTGRLGGRGLSTTSRRAPPPSLLPGPSSLPQPRSSPSGRPAPLSSVEGGLQESDLVQPIGQAPPPPKWACFTPDPLQGRDTVARPPLHTTRDSVLLCFCVSHARSIPCESCTALCGQRARCLGVHISPCLEPWRKPAPQGAPLGSACPGDGGDRQPGPSSHPGSRPLRLPG